MSEPEERWLTVQDVAKQLQVNVETVRRWIRSGTIAVLDLGPRGGYRIRSTDLRAFIDKRYGAIARHSDQT